MTNTTGNATAEPGWYDDPSGSGHKRWWDGTQWTEHVNDPSLTAYSAAIPAAPAGAPVYNAFIWLIVLLPLVSLVALAFYDFGAYARVMMAGGLPILSPGYLLVMALGWAIYLVTALLAFFDWRRLQRDGFVRPFHWAWSFLSGSVYIIGRSVIVRRRSWRGLAPIWAWIAVIVISFIVTGIKVSEAMSVVLANVSFS